jgi:hypothetical protein
MPAVTERMVESAATAFAEVDGDTPWQLLSADSKESYRHIMRFVLTRALKDEVTP